MANEFETDIGDEFVKLQKEYLLFLKDTIKEVENLIFRLESKPDADAFDKIVRIIHTMKGTAGTYDLTFVSTICHKFEDYLSINNVAPANFTKHADTLIGFLDLIRNYVDEFSGNGNVVTDKLNDQIEKLITIDSSKIHKVLIVEPSQNLYREYVKVLSNYNIETSLSENGYDALGRLLRERFDSLITATKIGILDGPSLTSSLRIINSKNRNIPTILITSDDEIKLIEQFKPTYFLKKGPKLFQELVNVYGGLVGKE